MTKLFKNSKSILSFVLAFAVLAVSLFTGVAIHSHAAAADEGTIDLLEFGDYLINDLGSTNKWYDNKLADNGETGADWANAIIIDSAEELVYLCKASGDDTDGKYYKVADGIAGFNLSTDKLDVNGTLTGASLADGKTNLDIVKGSGKNHSGGTPGFQGYFDGNGATVYGAWTNHESISPYAGLFSCVKGEVTIKNIHVKMASFTATNAAGGIVGYYMGEGNFTNNTTLNIENCSVTDSHLEVTTSNWGRGLGAIVGNVSCPASYVDANDEDGDGNTTETLYVNNKINVKNCYVNLNEDYFITLNEGTSAAGNQVCHGGVVGVAGTNAVKVSDCVVIGITPYATSISTDNNAVQHSGLEDHFANVYTTSNVPVTGVTIGGTLTNRNFTGKVIPLSDAQLKGAAAIENMDLDWSVWMADANGYPELANAHKNVTLVDKEDGTHAATCECGFGGIAVEHTFADGVCACGAELNCVNRKTITWDGSVATGIATGAGTKDNPYVIKTAAELAWLVQQKADVTTDKYYEIDPAIGAIVLQSADKVDAIKALDSAAATKAYFEAGTFTPWKTVGWEGSCFAGHFDGNGVTIYGLYAPSVNNAALFSTVDGGSAIRNIAVKNSYFTSSGGNYQVGALIGTTSSVGYGAKRQGIIWVSDVVIANNYMYNNAANPSNGTIEHSRSGIIGGVQEAIQVENCLVYGNDATYNDGFKMPLVANLYNNIVPAATHYDGLEPKISVNEATGETLYYNVVRNTVVLGTDIMSTQTTKGWRKNEPDCFENCYTDGASGTVAFTDGEFTYEDAQIKAITAADLATVELGSAWLNTATYPELKAFHDAEFTAVTDNGDGTHSATCSCGIAFKPEAHNIVEGECTVCDFACAHAETEFVEKTPADCTNNKIGNTVCKVCGKVLVENEAIADSALGHDMKEVKGTDATCTEPGVKTYYDCSRCDYVSEDAAGEKEITNLDEWKVIPEKGHTQAVDDKGVAIYKATEEGHQKVCGVCDQLYGEVESHIGEPVQNGAEGHKITCTVAGCGYAADNAPHNFGDDNKCDTCDWECTAHNYVDGETIELTFDQKYGENSELYKDVCYYVEQICTICGQKGENKVIDHTVGEWETKPYSDSQPACAGDGYHTEVRVCTECYIEVDSKTVTDPKTGHSFEDVDAVEGTCMSTGTIAHKYCNACGNVFATDAADDEAYENALNPFDGSMDTPIDPENHSWVEFGSEADCDNDGVVAHKYCTECDELVVGEETVDVEVDWDEYYKYDDEGNPVGPGAIVSSNYNKYENAAITDFIAENYADSGIEVPAYPEDDSDWEAMSAYFEVYDPIFYELSQIDENFSDAWGEYWLEYWATVQFEARYEYVTAAAEEAGVDFVAPAKGHTLVKVDEVAATYDKEGTKAHYACECGKLYSDAEGKNEVTAESLVIARLVKEDKPAGDGSTTSPVTGESVASVAAVAALVGAAFVLVRKSKKA